ncbi:MAG: hypothetical protein OXF11_06530 [Deltaproteobacteria bacterium]|nr:hypothetical protein [Deltaproteobacteria bacterium]
MAARKHLLLESIELTHINNRPLPQPALGKAVVRLHPRLGFSLDFGALPTHALPWGKLCRIRTAAGVEAEGYFQYSLNAPFYAPASFVLRKAPHIVMPSDAEIKKLEFRIVNFPSFFGRGAKHSTRKGTTHFFGAATGRFRGFRFDITERFGSTGVRYRPAHGHALTHNGVLRRDDRKPFSIEEAKENMRRLRAFLSFARGMACDLIPVHAVTGEGTAAFSWGTNFVEPAKPAATRWFPMNNGGDVIADLLGPFDNLWQQWGETLPTVVDWYTNAATSPAHVGVVLTQAAWEAMGYQILGKKTKGSSVLPLTLKKLGIDASIPATCGTLQQAFPGKDGPTAITQLRNELVHAKANLPNIPTWAHFDARNLSLWYVEMILLKHLRFSGRYFDRMQNNYLVLP